VTRGGGKIINREPIPDSIDPVVESLVRFHAQSPNHPFTLTSHLILYDEENKPAHLHRLEHVKSLKMGWLLESIVNFELTSTGSYVEEC